MLAPLEPFQLILPTRELVADFHTFDAYFYFYKGGVRGVIRDSIAMYNGLSFEDGGADGVFGSVFAEYENVVMDRPEIASTYERLEDIELLVDTINIATGEFLRNQFQQTQFQILRPLGWLADDLMVLAKVF